MIRVFEPKASLKSQLSVFNAVRNNEISGNSNNIELFEKVLAEYFNRKFAVALSNGTVALDLAIKSLNLKKGEEVIVPSFTIISCLSAIIRSDAKPIFCDVDPLTWNMNLKEIKKVLTKNTKAILLVHTYGLPSPASEIEEFCIDNNIDLIEDAAEAHGQTEEGRKCGSFGKISTLSFYANKHITTGEGVALLTDSEEDYKKIKQMINLDFSFPNRFNHDNYYWNYRLSGLQASLGLSSLKEISKMIKLKQKQASYYDEAFFSMSDLIQVPQEDFNSSRNHYWVYGILLKKENLRDKLIKSLYNSGIQTREFFWPLHLQNAYLKSNNDEIKLPNSEYLGRNGLYIPIGKHISKKNQNFIVREIYKNLNS